MAFGRKVDDPVDAVLPEQFTHRLEVADVAPDESVVPPLLDVREVGKVASIGQLVQVDNPVIGVFRHERRTTCEPMKPAPPVIRILRFMVFS